MRKTLCTLVLAFGLVFTVTPTVVAASEGSNDCSTEGYPEGTNPGCHGNPQPCSSSNEGFPEGVSSGCQPCPPPAAARAAATVQSQRATIAKQRATIKRLKAQARATR